MYFFNRPLLHPRYARRSRRWLLNKSGHINTSPFEKVYSVRIDSCPLFQHGLTMGCQVYLRDGEAPMNSRAFPQRFPRVKVGVSSCLLGQEVRFDGGHKRDGFLMGQLAGFVDFVPLCPCPCSAVHGWRLRPWRVSDRRVESWGEAPDGRSGRDLSPW